MKEGTIFFEKLKSIESKCQSYESFAIYINSLQIYFFSLK